MSGIVVIDRRDLERLLKHLVHEAKREDVKVDVKYYVQFAVSDEYSAQTIVDPWQSFPRSQARDLVKAAITRLDEEEQKRDGTHKALQVISSPVDADNAAATTGTSSGDHKTLDLETGVYQTGDECRPAEVAGSPNPHIEVDGVIL